MHELSIADALLEQVRRHSPPGAALQAVRVRVGPMRGIDPEAMQYAWAAATAGAPESAAKLELECLPWALRCPDCGAQFTSADLYAACACGSDTARPVGGDELCLVSIEVDDPASQAAAGQTR